MNDLLQLVLQSGYVLLFAFVSAEQIGLPIPAVPVLLARSSPIRASGGPRTCSPGGAGEPW